MGCIFDFLLDSEQARLRKLAQLQTEKFEDTIISYKKIFLNQLNLLKNEKIENSYFVKKNDEEKENNKNLEQLEAIRKIISEIPIKEIEKFFNTLKKVYVFWLKSQSKKAIETLEKLLEEYNLYDFKFNVANKLMYRGRITSSIPYNTYDMFHIPFNKRYLIGNQRFSLPGIPLLYLGMSLYDIAVELDLKSNEFDKISFSYFYIKDKNFKVYNLTNDFYQFFELNNIIENNVKPKNIKKEFFKLILSSVNSFEKKGKINEEKHVMFYEEYILPQILTQVLVNSKYNFKGILYSSTKLRNIENDKTYKTDYKNNVVIFTEYFEKKHYDYKLYRKFDISNPLTSNAILNGNVISVDKLKNLLNTSFLSTKLSIGSEFLGNFENIKIGEKSYFEHNIGICQTFMIYNFLLIAKINNANDKK